MSEMTSIHTALAALRAAADAIYDNLPAPSVPGHAPARFANLDIAIAAIERAIPTASASAPAPIPSGIQELGGGKYMADARGALVPLSLIKAADLLQDEVVRKIMGHALALSDQVRRFKEHTMGDLIGLDELMEQQYGLVKRGNRGKGNRTYMTVDTLYKVQVQIAESIDFGPELQVAKALLDECVNEWSAESRPEIQAMIAQAFATEKEGQISRAAIFMLLRLESQDPRWMRAMDAIRDAMRVVGRKEYVRFGMRASPQAEFSSVTIDLASA